MGCGIGDQARDLSQLGAYVFGVDGNWEAIDHARSRRIPRSQFVCANIINIKDSEIANRRNFHLYPIFIAVEISFGNW